ncbi:glycogen synthase [Sedimentisphaera salicampi]|uniref:starch synthase n=1 Tax=Sedimentisphaera salicampi TaxID=1941349 RepID=A0A1W6LJ65_9BACT|nr:glycogen/starch synthase [Sedimentisphaera salicampi]ARN55802.1 Glycogen synthase [Sedimentisphaera salicampi]
MAIKKRASKSKSLRILVVTPEVTYLPDGMGNYANQLAAKAGGLADVSASLISCLYELGADVHIAIPNFRRIFSFEIGRLVEDELRLYLNKLSHSRIHLAEDRVFYYQDKIYGNYMKESFKVSLAFQREVVNNIIPNVNPDIIHCNDWMTGLIPGFARRLNIPCLFTVHNIHTQRLTLEYIEEHGGIDAANFWQNLYYEYPPQNYEESRSSNLVDLLTSGIFAAHFINTVSPTFLEEIINGQHNFIPGQVRSEISNKYHSGCAAGILNSPDPSYNPETDEALEENYDTTNFYSAKKANKAAFQKALGLTEDPNAPLFFWPSRLDPNQKGCQLLAEILFKTINENVKENLQVAIVANGEFKEHFHNIAAFHNIHSSLAVHDFSENLSRLGFAASDFMLMPSLFEPCGLPQMIAPKYGSLPVANDTGGLHDTIVHMDSLNNCGNGFLFNTYNSEGLKWAIEQAVEFHKLPEETKQRQIKRVMEEANARFNHSVTAQAYIDIYEKMAKRPLID